MFYDVYIVNTEHEWPTRELKTAHVEGPYAWSVTDLDEAVKDHVKEV